MKRYSTHQRTIFWSRLRFVDGVVGVGSKILEATTNDFLIDPTEEYLTEREKQVHEMPCVAQYEDVRYVKIFEYDVRLSWGKN